jgi:hypothetical protein
MGMVLPWRQMYRRYLYNERGGGEMEDGSAMGADVPPLFI